jgi:hypothetical protein
MAWSNKGKPTAIKMTTKKMRITTKSCKCKFIQTWLLLRTKWASTLTANRYKSFRSSSSSKTSTWITKRKAKLKLLGITKVDVKMIKTARTSKIKNNKTADQREIKNGPNLLRINKVIRKNLPRMKRPTNTCSKNSSSNKKPTKRKKTKLVTLTMKKTSKKAMTRKTMMVRVMTKNFSSTLTSWMSKNVNC